MPKTLWIDTFINVNIATGGEDVTSLMTNIGSAASRFDALTLLRTIIRMDLAATVHDQGEGSSIVSLGIGVTSQEAFAGGLVPDPEIATDFPTRGWVWRSQYRVFSFQAGVADVHVREIDLDLRGRRKLENGECYIVIENTALEGTTAVRPIGVVRQLWLVG